MKIRVEGYNPTLDSASEPYPAHDQFNVFDSLRYGPIHEEGEMSREEMIREFLEQFPTFVEDDCRIIRVGEEKKIDGGTNTMKFYKIDDQVIISDKELSVGTLLTPNTTDAAGEKHVPVITINGDEVKVAVGSVEHPSLEAHYIEFIVLITSTGMQMKWLKPGNTPTATFKLAEGEKVVAAFEYCNLHGLWKAEV